MAQLNSIIGSMLRDMVLAQHQANLYAASLADFYGKDGALERFPLPGIALGELELDLHYGINGNNTPNANATDSAQYEINFSQLRKKLQTIADTYAAIMLSAATATLKRLFPEESSRGDNPLAKFEADAMLKGQYERFLSRKLLEVLRSEFTNILDVQTGQLNKQSMKETITSVGKAEIVNHADLSGLFESREGSKQTLEQAIVEAVNSSVDASLQSVNLMRRRLMPSVDVTVSSEDLSKLPSDSIQRMRVKLTPRDMQLFEEPDNK